MLKQTLKILAIAALMISWLMPFEAQGMPMDGTGFVELREGKLFHVEQLKDICKDVDD